MRLAILTVLIAIALGAFWAITRPQPLPASAFAGLTGDAEAGAAVFWATGCASCHAAPGAQGEDRLVLAGGRDLASDFGTFRVPNISTDPTHGIGGWSLAEFGNAMLRGVAPDGRWYYPAFPWASYRFATLQEVADLKAFMDTLPASTTPNSAHDLPLPLRWRRGIGLWAQMLPQGWALDIPLTEAETRGRHLVEALAHCAECHTPRTAWGTLDRRRWLAGAPNPSGPGRIPGLTPAQLSWSEAEIAGYLASGFTPSFDTAGGTMADVVASLAQLPRSDLDAIAAYLKRVPPVE